MTLAFLLLFLYPDKRTDNWLLVYSPVPIICVFLCYLVIIWAGPKLMVKRQPVDLKPVLIVYNFAMVCLSAYMFCEVTNGEQWGMLERNFVNQQDIQGSLICAFQEIPQWWYKQIMQNLKQSKSQLNKVFFGLSLAKT